MTNLEKFHFYLKDLESPNLVITWNFYFAVSCALARRVWTGHLDDFPIFANQYIIIVGPPASGKSLPTNKLKQLLWQLVENKLDEEDGVMKITNLVKVLPNSSTLESLMMLLQDSQESIMVENQKYTHRSMAFCLSEELATLFRQNTNDLVAFMTEAYNCGSFKRTIKHGPSYDIENMCVNLMGCTVPEWIGNNVTSGMIDNGFTSRIIFVYVGSPRHRIAEITIGAEQRTALLEFRDHLLSVAKLKGRLAFSKTETPEAFEWWEDWCLHKQDASRINKDKKLDNYYGRRKMHLRKLAMAVHFADKLTMRLDKEDFIKADQLLVETEVNMHNALLSVGRNPIHTIAEEIKKLLGSGAATESQILLHCFYIGTQDEIFQARQFLETTEQISSFNDPKDDNKVKYQLKKKQ